ncbi:MAG: hypothetical protein AB1425_04045 [Actinomycetota bacterium]
MQVYRELPAITNQMRKRPADLVGVVSVTEEWTVARHVEAANQIIRNAELPSVLDAGTGMYLNAILMDIEMAPKAPREIREAAIRSAVGAENERRAARARELEMMGAPERGSIWRAQMRYETHITYLRPKRETLDRAIRRRSARIVRDGEGEAIRIKAMIDKGVKIQSQVLGAIGVREMVAVVRGQMDARAAEEEIAARTRRLARRQMRWFDKLARELQEKACIEVAESASRAEVPQRVQDIIGT